MQLAADVWTPPARAPLGVVLLLHGGGQTRHSWHGTGRRLASSGWVAVSMDLRGHGDSEWAPDGDYTTGAHLEDLLSVVARLRETWGGIPLALVGASLGGKVALLGMGVEHRLAEALVMVDIAVRVETGGSRRVQRFMGSAPEGFASLQEASDAIAAYNPHRRRSGSLEGLKKNLRLREGRWHWHWDPAMLAPGRTDDEQAALGAEIYRRSRRAARSLTCPVMLVRGLQSDVVSAEGVAEMRELIPHLSVADVQDVGHMVAGDDNDVFTARLLDFLDEALPRTDSKEVS
ncbi:alpha/beta fold hydrolase [Streptomyces sulphureus]|uniref:alpha/beta fold hydrolase n=1 Tax=Streptomyces sulphureus TaxID=47758 RepID=UPI0003602036|nr:alpha/beta hydrolase [Streptomyces sulphureus]